MSTRMPTPASCVLLFDLRRWPMPQPGPGDALGAPVPRRLRVWQQFESDGSVLYTAVITERGAGMSVTNVAELAYAMVVHDLGQLLGTRIEHERVRIFEHYPASNAFAESFAQITVEPRPPYRPSWRQVPRAEMVALLGSPVLDAPAAPLPTEAERGN